MYVCIQTHCYPLLWRWKDSFQEIFCSPLLILGIDLRSSGLAARTFTLWAILLALKSIVDSCTVEGLKVLTIWKSTCNLWFLLNLTTENRPAVIGRLTRNRNIKFNIFCLLYILYVVKQNPWELRWLFTATGNVPERRRAQVEAIASCSVLETSAHCSSSSSRRWLLHYHSSAVMP